MKNTRTVFEICLWEQDIDIYVLESIHPRVEVHKDKGCAFIFMKKELFTEKILSNMERGLLIMVSKEWEKFHFLSWKKWHLKYKVRPEIRAELKQDYNLIMVRKEAICR